MRFGGFVDTLPPHIQMKDPYLELLKEKVLAGMIGEKVRIFVFGSRARNNYHRTSDIDIGLIPAGKLDRKKAAFLKEEIENLNIPYKVDIVDFSDVSEHFKQEALKDIIVWKD